MMNHQEISIIVALSENNNGIGLNGKLPWGKIPADLKHFKNLTTSHAVIMGRRTWYSIPKEYRPLNNRANVVLSRCVNHFGLGVQVAKNLDQALLLCKNYTKIFIIGGEMLYKETFRRNIVDFLYITYVDGDFAFDKKFPSFDMRSTRVVEKSQIIESGGFYIRFIKYRLHDEFQYLNLVKDVLEEGLERLDRTNIGTLALFGKRMRFSLLNKTIPLITTKRTYWKAIVTELLWFISGCTNSKTLEEQGVNIWKANSSREFLDSVGLADNAVGDIGPNYGFQWRHFGAEYQGCGKNYLGQGVDQLQNVIRLIRTNPDSRRIVLSAWNPVDLNKMSLNPCHILVQFWVQDGLYLDSQMYQRSGDIGLGVPFNIASYALLTHMIAHITGLQARTFTHVLGDTHIYKTHVNALAEQLKRCPFTFPKVEMNKNIQNIDNFKVQDIRLINYQYHSSLKIPMAV